MNLDKEQNDSVELVKVDDQSQHKENSEPSKKRLKCIRLNGDPILNPKAVEVDKDMLELSQVPNSFLEKILSLSGMSTETTLGNKEATNISQNNNKVEFKSKIPVDRYAKACLSGWSVLEDNDFGLYSIVLNKVDTSEVKTDVLQVLKKDGHDQYTLYQRCGEIDSTIRPIYYSGLKESIMNILYAKLQERISQGYKGTTGYEKNVYSNTPSSKLHMSVGKIMEIICNTYNMAKKLNELEFDLKKMPLESITKQVINNGCGCLKSVEIAIKSGNRLRIIDSINKYYRTIPRKFNGKTAKIIETTDDIEKEILLLHTLYQIEEIIKFFREDKAKLIPSRHPMDILYDSMKWRLDILPPGCTIRETIQDIIEDTDGFQNSSYKCSIKNVFEIKRKTEDYRLLSDSKGSTKLLWYGVKVTNWYIIDSRGLHVLPKDTYATVKSFNKGFYIADVSPYFSISSCFNGYGNVGYFGLVEAIIENSPNHPKLQLQISEKLPENDHINLSIPSRTFYSGEEILLCNNNYTIHKPDDVSFRYIVELEFVSK